MSTRCSLTFKNIQEKQGGLWDEPACMSKVTCTHTTTHPDEGTHKRRQQVATHTHCDTSLVSSQPLAHCRGTTTKACTAKTRRRETAPTNMKPICGAPRRQHSTVYEISRNDFRGQMHPTTIHVCAALYWGATLRPSGAYTHPCFVHTHTPQHQLVGISTQHTHPLCRRPTWLSANRMIPFCPQPPQHSTHAHTARLHGGGSHSVAATDLLTHARKRRATQ